MGWLRHEHGEPWNGPARLCGTRTSLLDGSTVMNVTNTVPQSGTVGDCPGGNKGIRPLLRALGTRARCDVPLRDHTAIRTGGPADVLVTCETLDDLVEVVALARECQVPWLVLGGGCNVLVADAGVRGLVIICRASEVRFRGASSRTSMGCGPDSGRQSRRVHAEGGALLTAVAREAVARGMAGLEWAAGLPGTVGGAVVGNAGAFEGDVANTMVSALVLAHDGDVYERGVEWFELGYRTSRLKRESGERHVLLSAQFALEDADPAQLAARADEILTWRRTRHPSGATMGSTFKNPRGSHAGYLIEQAGLRGHRIGGVEISSLHGNFLMNTGAATAHDVRALIEYARSEVERQFGIDMELEIELIGW